MPAAPLDLALLSADQLTAELARREAETQRQQAEEQAARSAEQERSARAVLAGWKAEDEDLIADEAEAYDAFRAVVLDDPMVAAYVLYRRARFCRAQLRTKAQNAAGFLGQEQVAERIADLRYADFRLFEDVRDIADAEASRLAGLQDEED